MAMPMLDESEKTHAKRHATGAIVDPVFEDCVSKYGKQSPDAPIGIRLVDFQDEELKNCLKTGWTASGNEA